jgi:uncharacterized damage-inducible protein DinB
MEVADAAVWSAAMKDPAANVDSEVCRYLVHTSSAQRAFLDAWKGRPFAFRYDYDGVRLDAELVAARSYYPEARAFIAGLEEAALADTCCLPWESWVEEHIKQTVSATTLGETILQVISHGTHHRAQANVRLRALGIEPPIIDYIFWLWRGRPRPEWPGAAAGV